MKRGRDWELEKCNLERLILDEKRSYLYIGDMYGCSGTHIKNVARKLGINVSPRRRLSESEIDRLKNGNWTPVKAEECTCLFCGKTFRKHSHGMGKFCNQKCFFDCKNRENSNRDEILIKKWLNGEIDGTNKKYFTYKPFVRKYLFRKYNNKCQRCGWGETNKSTGLVPLQIHHIDGDALNNDINNIELLCPNCHSLTDNFGSRNKNATEGRSECYGRAFIKRRIIENKAH